MGFFSGFLGGVGVLGVAGRDEKALKNAAQTHQKGVRSGAQGVQKGYYFSVPVGGVEGRPDVRREGVRVCFLQAGIDLQSDLRIRVAGQVLDALQVHL